MLTFGSFTISPDGGSLYRGTSKVRLGSRALKILITLVERKGEVVTSQELMARVWDGVFVEESNLRVNICALRKALSDGEGQQSFIHNVPGRGYRFTAVSHPSAPPTAQFGGEASAMVPEALIGRTEFVRRAGCETERKRLVTLVGTGGIGKTSIAQVIAARWLERSGIEAIFVDLAAISSGDVIPEVAAAAAGLAGIFEDATAALVRHLKGRRALIILDNCEHVIEEAARLTDAILTGAANVHILATSREALRCKGEKVLRVPALKFPGPDADLTAETALEYPAVRMFAAAANAADEIFALTNRNCELVGSICRRLDGVPLAIELAAAHVGTLGVERLSIELDSKLRLPARGRRGGSSRHQTLHAALRWSYDLLSAPAKEALENFACFAGTFDLEAALYMTRDVEVPGGTVLDLICDLVDKSLLSVEGNENTLRYRLLETTRAFLLDRLDANGRGPQVRERHANLLIKLLHALKLEMTQEAIRRALDHMADVRRALQWCFDGDQSAALGACLTTIAATFWMKLLLMSEHSSFMLRAKQFMEGEHDCAIPVPDRIALYLTLALTWYHRTGVGPEMNTALGSALKLARASGNTAAEIKVVWLSYAFLANDGAYATEQALVSRYRELTQDTNDPFTEFIFYRMQGRASHDLGRHAEGERYCRRALVAARSTTSRLTPYDVEIDMWSAAKGTLARTLWVRGLPDQARSMASESLKEALDLNHSATVCWTLIFNVIPVNFWCGDLEVLQSNIRLLTNEAKSISEPWYLAGELYRDALNAFRLGREFLVNPALVRTRRGQFDIFATLPIALPGDFVAKLEDASENWASPELMRRRAERMLKADGLAAADAAWQLLTRARTLARTQGALAWELRIALGIFELSRRRGDGTVEWIAAREVLDRFTEGRDTIDIRRAQQILGCR